MKFDSAGTANVNSRGAAENVPMSAGGYEPWNVKRVEAILPLGSFKRLHRRCFSLDSRLHIAL